VRVLVALRDGVDGDMLTTDLLRQPGVAICFASQA
jgi:hypothetical protein